jgi:hypothetical protein
MAGLLSLGDMFTEERNTKFNICQFENTTIDLNDKYTC